MDESAEVTNVAEEPRSKWKRFTSLFLRHLLPILCIGIGMRILLRTEGLLHNHVFVGAAVTILVVLVVISTRACLESLICLLLTSEAVCLAYFYEANDSWPVVWTRVTVLQLLVGIALFVWLTVLRIREREFSTWVFSAEVITVLSFATNIYFHAAYWYA